MKPLLPAILAISATALQATGTILLSDDFSNGNRTSPAWYYAHGAAGATLTTNGARQNLLLDAAGSNNAQVWTTFTTTALNVGQTLSVSFNFDASGAGGSADDGPFRVGLFNITNPVNTDKNSSIADTSWNSATGYGAFVDIHGGAIIDTTPESTLRQRNGGISDTLWAGAAHTSFATTLTPVDASYSIGSSANLTTDPLRYFVTFSLSRTGTEAIDLFFEMRDQSNNLVSRMNSTDTSGLVTSFNTFSVFTGLTVAQDFAIDNVVISIVPEPSTLLAAGLAPLLLTFRRRR